MTRYHNERDDLIRQRLHEIKVTGGGIPWNNMPRGELTSNIPTCQRGLQQVGGAHPPVASAPAGTYQGVQFVDEQDRGS